jgi:hypothetical protein
MPWCPKCKTEYREGFTVCSDCGSPLVEAMKEDRPEDCIDEKTDSLNEPARLMQVGNEYEADNIIALLAGEGIPAYISHKGSGQYLSITMGMSNMGVDIFVPKSALQQAKEILADAKHDGSYHDENTGNDSEKDHLKDDTNCRKEQEEELQPISSNTKRVRLARFLLIPLVISLAYILVTLIRQAIQYFFS